MTMHGVGRRMADQVVIGGYGAYIVDDDRYDYYIVKWIDLPQEAEEDRLIELDGEQFTVKKGEMFATGEWLDLVQSTRRWWKHTSQRCIVRLQTSL